MPPAPAELASHAAPLTFSVIVNTVDRAAQLRTLLRALEQQTYPHFEVIAVVGPTKDDTLSVLAEYSGRVIVERCAEANLSLSRNVGLLRARGDIVAYTDDDAVPCANWLAALARLFENPRLDGTGGEVSSVYPQASFPQHRLGVVSSLAEHANIRASWLDGLVPLVERSQGHQWFPRMMGANMAFRRAVLLEIGGFDAFYIYIAEESDVAARLAHAGKVSYPVTEAPVYHLPASSRNRIVFTNIGRWWWLDTRSAAYFSVKNGRDLGESAGVVFNRLLKLVHGHWQRYAGLQREGELGLAQAAQMAALELRGVSAGAWGGLFSQRQLIDRAEAERALMSTEALLPFLDERSRLQPAVDPVNGRQPSITLSEPPLRICLLSHTYPPKQYDGVARLTHLMARGLFEQGHAVHVITTGERSSVAFYDGAYVHAIKYALDRYQHYKAMPRLFHALNHSHAVHDKVKRLVQNDGIQVVDSPLWLFEGLTTAVSGALPVAVRLVTAGAQVATLHDVRDDDTRIVGDMERELIARATHVLPNTRATLENTVKTYGIEIEPARTTIVPYGIVPAADDAVRAFDPARAEDDLTVLFVGRLEKRKGITDLFAAIPRVLSAVPRARFVIAGADNSRHDGFAERTGLTYPAYFAHTFAACAERVSFTGAVSDDDLQRLYQSCDLFVAPSLYESFGLVYLEAMNFGKPVIGCRAGGIPEVVDDGVTGLLVEPEAPARLAEAIVSLLSSPAHLRDYGQAGRAQVLEKYAYTRMAQQFAAAYRRAIAAHAAAHAANP